MHIIHNNKLTIKKCLWKIIECLNKKHHFGDNNKLRIFKQVIHIRNIVIISYTQSYAHYPQKNKEQVEKNKRYDWGIYTIKRNTDK